MPSCSHQPNRARPHVYVNREECVSNQRERHTRFYTSQIEYIHIHIHVYIFVIPKKIRVYPLSQRPEKRTHFNRNLQIFPNYIKLIPIMYKIYFHPIRNITKTSFVFEKSRIKRRKLTTPE